MSQFCYHGIICLHPGSANATAFLCVLFLWLTIGIVTYQLVRRWYALRVHWWLIISTAGVGLLLLLLLLFDPMHHMGGFLWTPRTVWVLTISVGIACSMSIWLSKTLCEEALLRGERKGKGVRHVWSLFNSKKGKK